jgi:hypothetical protein
MVLKILVVASPILWVKGENRFIIIESTILSLSIHQKPKLAFFKRRRPEPDHRVAYVSKIRNHKDRYKIRGKKKNHLYFTKNIP